MRNILRDMLLFKNHLTGYINMTSYEASSTTDLI